MAFQLRKIHYCGISDKVFLIEGDEDISRHPTLSYVLLAMKDEVFQAYLGHLQESGVGPATAMKRLVCQLESVTTGMGSN
jgi:hypothetical protein